jgi:hypothetical protein
MQKKTAVSLATLALIGTIAATAIAAANVVDIASAVPADSSTSSTPVVSTTVATTGTTWSGDLPDASVFPRLDATDRHAVVARVDELIGDLRGTEDGATLVERLAAYRAELGRTVS